ncbi:MAG: response regulator transcription factor [Anaerolineales bacterium]|nr:response regulator transcription factor [Anaerolineales bacterium]MCB8990055.1 response regulator transcription factor [Ardenticatenaceae bacterium]MCB9005634.1 response regulator transcription factor [Ardenticatenaceae bacterium]
MKILVVDDDRVLADLVAFTLRHEGFQVRLAYNGETALTQWETERPDLVVLDLNLPKVDGFTVCRRIRAEADTPIIMLTVRGEEDDIVHGLEVGADDYITKPFSPRQLVARVQAVLRRAGKGVATAVSQTGLLLLDQTRREVRVQDSDPITLTPLETRLLHYLMSNVGHVLSNDAIIAHVWGPEGGDRDMVRQLVRRLRLKIEPDPANPTFIETVPGLGYGLRQVALPD